MKGTEVAIFGGGCFWCTEAVFSAGEKGLKGIVSVTPGYAGGSMDAPDYKRVSSGRTGHAEVIRIEFDPSQVSYETLLTIFFATHDPTTLNRQGEDVGTQYRSIILYTNETQKVAAEKFIADLNATDKKGSAIVTEVRPLDEFYEAEEHHKNYYARNSRQPYCQVVINPKLKKVQEQFRALLNAQEK